MLKNCVYVLTLFILVCVLICYPTEVFASRITTITVDIEHNKSNDNGWDANLPILAQKAPDIAMCISHSLVGTLCLPEGDHLNNIKTAQCLNSYHCRFSVETPDRNFKISVVDVDLMYNDLIGTGHCSQHRTCTIGQASVTVD